MASYPPAEAGFFQSARCPPGRSPQTRLVFVISRQPLEMRKHTGGFFIHNAICVRLHRRGRLDSPWTNIFSISVMSSTASPLTATEGDAFRQEKQFGEVEMLPIETMFI